MADALRELVFDIYDTVAEPDGWADILDRMTEDLGGFGCIVFEWEGGRRAQKLIAPHFSGRYHAEMLSTYLEKCFSLEAEDQDIFEAHSLNDDLIDLVDDSVIAPSIAALRQRRNVEILEMCCIRHRAAGLLDKTNTAQARFSVQLGTDRGPLSAADHAYLRDVLPHVAKALDLGRPARQLAVQHKSLITAMDRLTIGICILKGRCIVANEEFRRQLASYRIFCLGAAGQFDLREPDWQARFAALQADALAHGRFGARPRKEAIPTGSDSFLCIELAPLKSLTEIGTTPLDGFILYSIETSRPLHCHAEPIQEAYHLTATEMSVIREIAKGGTNAQIAQQRARSVETVNHQVKSILSKTGCANRTQLVRLMMSFGAGFLTRPN